MATTQASGANRGDEQTALVALVDGLLERMLRSPLMRRAAAQCSAEEQLELASLLGDLVGLRALRASLETLPVLRFDHLAAYWPELSELLSPPKRGGVRQRPNAVAPAAPTLGGLYDSDGHLAAQDQPTSQESVAQTACEPQTSTSELPALAGPDLAHLILEALTVQGRALNTTQMLAWLREKGASATREDVMNTLFGHEELFRRRGAGHWVVAGRDSS